jgi:uncharacterized membrane protein (UPF0127 family)
MRPLSKGKNFWLYISLVLVLFMTYIFVKDMVWSGFMEQNPPYLVINDRQVWLEIADSDVARARGLSGREALAEQSGMLFVFLQSGRYSFWMKEMKFNLDLIFIDGDQVVDLVAGVPFPQSGQSPVSVNARRDFDKVLEVNEGMIDFLGVKVGDQVSFSL